MILGVNFGRTLVVHFLYQGFNAYRHTLNSLFFEFVDKFHCVPRPKHAHAHYPFFTVFNFNADVRGCLEVTYNAFGCGVHKACRNRAVGFTYLLEVVSVADFVTNVGNQYRCFGKKVFVLFQIDVPPIVAVYLVVQ
nr:MAG TPA: hypothetical protein [Caudoviricetes sp.]